MKGIDLLRHFAMCMTIWIPCQLCLARFDERDADRIDQEDILGIEHYNDIISYEHPVHWDRKWDAADIGYRVSAGSFNDKMFYYKEDIKLSSPVKDPVVLSFKQTRREDLLEEVNERQAKIGFKQLAPLTFSILGNSK